MDTNLGRSGRSRAHGPVRFRLQRQASGGPMPTPAVTVTTTPCHLAYGQSGDQPGEDAVPAHLTSDPCRSARIPQRMTDTASSGHGAGGNRNRVDALKRSCSPRRSAAEMSTLDRRRAPVRGDALHRHVRRRPHAPEPNDPTDARTRVCQSVQSGQGSALRCLRDPRQRTLMESPRIPRHAKPDGHG
jgi:hypothetical protein